MVWEALKLWITHQYEGGRVRPPRPPARASGHRASPPPPHPPPPPPPLDARADARLTAPLAQSCELPHFGQILLLEEPQLLLNAQLVPRYRLKQERNCHVARGPSTPVRPTPSLAALGWCVRQRLTPAFAAKIKPTTHWRIARRW